MAQLTRETLKYMGSIKDSVDLDPSELKSRLNDIGVALRNAEDIMQGAWDEFFNTAKQANLNELNKMAGGDAVSLSSDLTKGWQDFKSAIDAYVTEIKGF